VVAAAGRIGPSVRLRSPVSRSSRRMMPSGPKKPPAGFPVGLDWGEQWSRSRFPSGARDPFGQFSSGVPHVSRRFISCSRQSTDRTQRTPHNLLDEFRWARAFRRCRCRVDLLAIAYLSHQLGTGRSQLIAGAAEAWPQRTAAAPARSQQDASSARARPRRLRVRYERAGRSLLLGRRSGRRQDDVRSDRRGAADGAGVEAQVTLRS
jgi:hypothetical protein